MGLRGKRDWTVNLILIATLQNEKCGDPSGAFSLFVSQTDRKLNTTVDIRTV